jgi:hypothetical protein
LRGKNDWIYGLVENYKTKFNESKLVKESVLAIREVCANNSLTTHSLRNSFCNRVILAVAPATGNVELARRLRESLLEVVDQRWISHLKSKTLDTNDWPFWIDRVEMMMGHEGMYSFYWYWKCDFVCLAEHASQSNKTLANEWRVGDLAKILNISPGLVSQRSKFLRGDSAEQAFDWEAVVSDRIKLHSLHKPRKVLSGSQPSVEAKTVEIDASIFHSLLISRFKNGWQIQDLTSHLPNGICLKEPHLELVLAQYQNLVRSTGIDDFEPKTSELLTVQRPRYTEIVSKSGERQTKLQLAWEFLKTDIGNQVLSSIQYWSRSVNYANSFWVIQNDNQIKPCIEFLIAIGFDPKTLIIWATDSYEFQIAIDKISDFQIPLKRSPTRFTKGPQHIKESECAIAIEEITPKNIRNSREIPRILLTLISCVLAKSDNT